MPGKTKRRLRTAFIRLTALVLTLLSVFSYATLVFANEIYPEASGITSGVSYALKNKASGRYLSLPGYFDIFPSDETETPNKTVTLQSATVGGMLPDEYVFYKVNENGYISDHSEMIKGIDDDTTIEFICDIIGLNIFDIENMDTDDYLYDNYGIYRSLI